MLHLSPTYHLTRPRKDRPLKWFPPPLTFQSQSHPPYNPVFRSWHTDSLGQTLLYQVVLCTTGAVQHPWLLPTPTRCQYHLCLQSYDQNVSRHCQMSSEGKSTQLRNQYCVSFFSPLTKATKPRIYIFLHLSVLILFS